jgi:hypothetical protein
MKYEQPQPLDDESLRAVQLTEAYRLFVAQEGWTATQDYFASHYRGTWPSLTDYGQDLVRRLRMDADILETIPKWLAPFMKFDYAAFGRRPRTRQHHDRGPHRAAYLRPFRRSTGYRRRGIDNEGCVKAGSVLY